MKKKVTKENYVDTVPSVYVYIFVVEQLQYIPVYIAICYIQGW